MFFYQRKHRRSRNKRRVVKSRDEWGVLQFHFVDTEELTDKELQEVTKTTVTWRRFP